MKNNYFSLLLLAVLLVCSGSVQAQKKKVAFVIQTEGSYNTYTTATDPIYVALAAAFDVTIYQEDKESAPNIETLKTYDLVVMSEAMAGKTTFSNGLVAICGEVPVLNMKAYTYTSGRWSWGTPANPGTKCPSVTINTGSESHPIFSGVTVNNGVVQIFDGTATSNNQMQGFNTPTGPVAFDLNIIATTTEDGLSAIHEIKNWEDANKKAPYMLIPISSDAIGTVTANGTKLVVNACNYLLSTSTGIKDQKVSTIKRIGDVVYNPELKEVTIYDITGVAVMKSTDSQIAVNQLPAGLYIAKGDKETIKFVK